MHVLLESLPEHFGLRLQEMGGTLSLQLAASNDLVDGDSSELSILFDNLLDNAIKYKRENVPPEIRISSQNKGSRLRIRVEDNGMGMTRETLSHIFERFYRAHTGNRHDVKGFGLGLSHVRSILDAHRAKVRVESTVGKGSAFIIDFPMGSKA
jgi:two-component system phosphate regulon sensor histidine kinase PhoR